MSGSRAVSIRLAPEGDEQLRARLQAIGTTGTEAFDAVARATTRGAAAFDALQRRLDPAFAAQTRLNQAQQEFARSQDQITNAVTRGLATQDRANFLLGQAEQRYRSITTAAAAATTATNNLAAANQRAVATGLRSAFLGQAGYQAQDAAIQLQMGTNPLTVIAQQGSQFLGALGPGGAIAGAAVAISAVAASVLLATAGIKSFEDRVKELGDTLQAQASALQAMEQRGQAFNRTYEERANIIRDLRIQFEQMSEAERRATEQTAIAAERAAATTRSRALNLLGEVIPGRVLARSDRVLQDEAELRRQIGAADDVDVRRLTDQQQRTLRQADGVREAARQLAEARALIAAADPAQRAGPGGEIIDPRSFDSFRGVQDVVDRLRAALEAYGSTGVIARDQQEELNRKITEGVASASTAAEAFQRAQNVLAALGVAANDASRSYDQFLASQARAAARTVAELEEADRRNQAIAGAGSLAEVRRLQDQNRQQDLERRNRERLDQAYRQQNAGRDRAGVEADLAEGGTARTRIDALAASYARNEVAANRAATATNSAATAQTSLNRRIEEAARVTGAKAEQDRAMAAAIVAGDTATRDLEVSTRAAAEAAKYGAEGTAAYQRAIELLTPRIRDQIEAQEALRNANAIRNQRQQLELIEEETRLVGANADVRDRELAILRERQRILSENSGNRASLDTDEARQRLDLVARIADSSRELERSRNLWTEIGDVGSRAFDRIGTSITEALANGTLKTISFGNIWRATMAEAAQAALRLGVINPVLNAAFGGTRASIWNAGSLGGGTGINVPGGNVANGAGAGGFSLDKLLGSDSPLSGVGRLFGGNFNTGIGFVDNILGTPLYSIGDIAGATNSALGSLGTGVYGPATPGAVSAAGGSSVTLGGAAAGVAGIAGGAYSLYNAFQTGGPKGIAQGVSGAAGIAAGAGALAGGSTAIAASGGAVAGALGGTAATALGAVAAAAPYVAVIAAIVAALLPGQKPSNAAAGGTIDLRTGQRLTDDSGKSTPETRGARDQLLTLMEQQAAQLGAITGVRPVGSVHFEIGARDPSRLHLNGMDVGSAPVGDVNALADLFSRALIDAYRRTDDLDIQQRLIIDKSGDLQTAIDNISWYQGVYKPFVDNAALDPNDVQRSNAMKALQDQIAALQKPFEDAAAKARELGLATEQLVQAQAAALEDFNRQRERQWRSVEQGLDVRFLRATGQEVEAALMEQRVQAEQEREAFRQQLLQIAPEEGNTAWRELMLRRLDEVQTAERQQVAAQQLAAQQSSAANAAAGTISSLTGYARSLRIGDASPLGYREQYDLASRDFYSVQDLAASGNADAIARLQESASTFLSASRTVNGSGAAFAADNQRVLAAIEAVAARGASQLTQDFMATQIRNQTATLDAGLRALKEELEAVRRELRQLQLAPKVGS